MSLDFLDKAGSALGGAVALATAGLAVLGYLRARGRRGWRTVLTPLWRSQEDDALGHPYRLAGGYLRPLSEVYVPRRAVPRADPAGGTVAADPTPSRPGEGLLAGAGHVLLIGEPGSGKSALVRQACAVSARHWLAARGRRRRLPAGLPVAVALPAGALVGRALPAALSGAHPLPDVDFAAPPAPGRRWLVCVDGVDAVADPDERAEVLNRLAALARPAAVDPPWRLLVTTRQLAEAELAVLGPGFTAYHLAPFGPAEVRRFAYRWFSRAATAEAFLSWADADRATTAARTPLTLTVAAVVWEAGPPGGTPRVADPTALLARFVDALLDAGRAGVDTVGAALRRASRGGPVADWLAERHTELVEVAAAAALAGGDPVAAVVEWSAGQAPHPPDRVLPDWSRHVRLILLGTGLFAAGPGPAAPAAAAGRLVPTWPGPVEYLAAGPLARNWRPDRWVAAMTTTSQRGLGLYAVGRGVAAPDFLRLVARDPAGAVAAGHYLAAGGPVDPVVRADVLAALLAHWSAPPVDDIGGPVGSDVPGECHALLTTLVAAPADRAVLRAIAVDPRRSRAVRRAAALLFATRRTADAGRQVGE
ncbi:hypothetical protein O7606_03870 [Micromonospora sp. WMMD882]|uniref:AAA family ATPase n=1 Tax=Micromonospora sp. WMMD882 TaxID=3015151 RepID=UPI00248CE940|nr:AAA family ATPase [Micromonospora sp. WMMD882]WBB80535.1 hypothetical protein O7606_03870 [Micromonospora sp. WMMD882]